MRREGGRCRLLFVVFAEGGWDENGAWISTWEGEYVAKEKALYEKPAKRRTV